MVTTFAMFKLWLMHLSLQYGSDNMSEHNTNYNPSAIHRISIYEGQHFPQTEEAILKTWQKPVFKQLVC